jgi:hypothetical protein
MCGLNELLSENSIRDVQNGCSYPVFSDKAYFARLVDNLRRKTQQSDGA